MCFIGGGALIDIPAFESQLQLQHDREGCSGPDINSQLSKSSFNHAYTAPDCVISWVRSVYCGTRRKRAFITTCRQFVWRGPGGAAYPPAQILIVLRCSNVICLTQCNVQHLLHIKERKSVHYRPKKQNISEFAPPPQTKKKTTKN